MSVQSPHMISNYWLNKPRFILESEVRLGINQIGIPNLNFLLNEILLAQDCAPSIVFLKEPSINLLFQWTTQKLESISPLPTWNTITWAWIEHWAVKFYPSIIYLNHYSTFIILGQNKSQVTWHTLVLRFVRFI